MTEDTFPWMLNFTSAKNWLDTLRSEQTKEIYVLRLKMYCDGVGKNPDELIQLKIDGLTNVATAKEFQAESLLNNYLYHNNLTSNVQMAVLSAVKSFYKANWRELNSNVGTNIESPEPKKRTPKMQDIIELEDAMTYLRDKAILWFLESAPFRVGTLTKLKWKDLKSTSDLLKQVREEAKGQISRTPDEDAEIAEKVPYYLLIESARMKGGGKGRYKGVKQVGFIHGLAAKKLDKYKLELKEHNLQINEDSHILLLIHEEKAKKWSFFPSTMLPLLRGKTWTKKDLVLKICVMYYKVPLKMQRSVQTLLRLCWDIKSKVLTNIIRTTI